MPPTVYAIATMDTKGAELAFVRECLVNAGIHARMVDVGTRSEPTVTPDIARDLVLGSHAIPTGDDRGTAVTKMGHALRDFLIDAVENNHVDGVIGIGGSGGTALITEAMRALPVGFPKLMVSTVASGNTEPYVDCTDITMMYSVVDVAGLNAVSRRVLANGAHAIAGMVKRAEQTQAAPNSVGMTMFGVTTDCVTRIREQLEAKNFDCFVFHATGTGGRAMEKLVQSRLLNGVIDLTTTEVADEIVGGIFPAGAKRFEATLKAKVPLVLSVGAVDMVNFGAIETIPEPYRKRLLYKHNPQVTLMRTTADENRKIAEWIVQRLNRSSSPLTVILPEGGVSALDAPSQPFHDPSANAALFETFDRLLDRTEERRLLRSPHQINDPEFSDLVTKEFLNLWTI